MIDIIIPTYNNKKGLLKTLQSIPNQKELVVTIIDDCSTQNIDYGDIEKQYNFIKLSNNCGPGNVRQYGIEHTKEPYIMFIDTGDYFLDNIFNDVIVMIERFKNTNIFGWSHVSEKNGKVSSNANNHLHGKVYKREFLNKYNITFCKESSFINEDIGFNRICRLLTNIKFVYKTIYMWSNDPDSITRRNNGEFSYKNQNIGLALNGIHIYNSCKNYIDPQLLELECGEIMGALYNGVVKTAQERPEFINQAWEGALIFYNRIYKPNKYGINISIQHSFTKTIKEAQTKGDKWKKTFPMNLSRFLLELDKNGSVPNYYL